MFGGKKIVLLCKPSSHAPFPFFFFKITIPHNENKFLCEFIAFVCEDFKEILSQQIGNETEKRSQKKHIVIQPTLKAVKALKWKRASTVSVTMKE